MEKLRNIFKKTARFSAAITLLIFPLLLIYGDIFLKLWVGDAIASMVKYTLPLLIIASLISQLSSGLLNFIVVGTGELKLFNAYIITKALVLCFGLIVFIFSLGLPGAGIAFLLVSLVDCGYLVIFLQKVIIIPFFELFRFSYATPLINSAIMCLIGLALRPYISGWLFLIVSCTLLSTIYFAGGVLLKIFGETEKQVVVKFLNSLTKPFKYRPTH